jgi:hypothetical protein
MKLGLAEHWTGSRLNRALNSLPFRGRLLFFGGGFFIGAGGLGGAGGLLYANREDATRPPDVAEDSCREVGVHGENDAFVFAAAAPGPALRGRLQRWRHATWSWWLPHWEEVEAEVGPHGLLLLRPAPRAHAAAAAAQQVGQVQVRRLALGGATCHAVPLRGAALWVRGGAPPTAAGATQRGAGGRRRAVTRGEGVWSAAGDAASLPPPGDDGTLRLRTAAGEVEHLRVPACQRVEELERWRQALAAAGAELGAAAPWEDKAQQAAPTKRRAAPTERRVVEVSLPATWEAEAGEGSSGRSRVVRLLPSSEEYRRVATLAVRQQLDGDAGGGAAQYVKGRLEVTGVSRVQSPRVWEKYCMRRAIVAAENGGDPNEVQLWHGTGVTSLVCRKGLDPRVCSLGGMFGGGVYFADKSTKSVRYAGASKRGDTGQLILCRVSLGRQMRKFLPEGGLRRVPDPFPLFPTHVVAWLKDATFHSLFAPAGSFPSFLLMNEYIVFHTNQGFPEYVVDFKLV